MAGRITALRGHGDEPRGPERAHMDADSLDDQLEGQNENSMDLNGDGMVSQQEVRCSRPD